MKSHIIVAALTSVMLASACSPCRAQDRPQGDSPLSGPKVIDRREVADKPSLVAFDFDANVIRPEASPEEAALRLLSLDAASKSEIDKLLRERMIIVDQFVATNLDLLTKFGNAEATGNKLDQAMLLAQAAQKLTPLWKRGSLANEIEKHLPPDAKPEYERLLTEYYTAVRDETRRNTGEKKPLWAIRVDERLKALGREIERSFKRQLYNGEIIFQYITPRLHLRPEQEARVREVCAKFAEELNGNDATKPQQVRFVLELGKALDPDQRKVLGQILRGEQARKSDQSKPKGERTTDAKNDAKHQVRDPNSL
jgi:hypothetical protein